MLEAFFRRPPSKKTSTLTRCHREPPKNATWNCDQTFWMGSTAILRHDKSPRCTVGVEKRTEMRRRLTWMAPARQNRRNRSPCVHRPKDTSCGSQNEVMTQRREDSGDLQLFAGLNLKACTGTHIWKRERTLRRQSTCLLADRSLEDDRRPPSHARYPEIFFWCSQMPLCFSRRGRPETDETRLPR